MRRFKAVASIYDAALINRTVPGRSRQLSTALQRESYAATSPSSFNTAARFPASAITTRKQKSIRHASSTPSSSTELRKTPLYDLHISNGGKMVPFGGFHMPVQYSGLSVSASHHFTREHASLFDVSHMVQHRFEGPGATAFLQRITPASIANLALHQGGLSCLLHPGTGGIVDDTIITRLGPELFYVVTNAGCREKDLKYLGRNWRLALQGPESEEILKELLAEEMKEGGFDNFLFGQSRFVKIRLADGSTSGNLLVSRGGYTGEDGFEISIPESETVMVTESLLKSADDTTTPVEAALGWVVGKERRTEGGFHGAEVILKQLTPKSKGGSGVERRRIGLIVEGAPAREGADIVNDKGEKIGNITSGCPSPTLGKNVAMGYIKDGFHKAGTDVSVVVRGKERKAKVTKMPFVPSKYWKGTSGTAPA
ncbi:glycine cleavage system T protein [Botrytis cinerea]